jgi:hypothetical protein
MTIRRNQNYIQFETDSSGQKKAKDALFAHLEPELS